MSRLRGFMAGLLCGVALVALVETAGARAGYSPYRKLDIFARVLAHIENNYVDHVDDKKLIYGAIKGMLASLDPHSTYMTPREYKQLKDDTMGRFGGLGIEVEIRGGWLTIVSPLEGTPAHRAGIKSGDQIIEIEGKSTRDITMRESTRKLRGPRGTRVEVTIRRAGVKKPFKLSIVRDVIRIVSVSSKMLAPGVGYIRVKAFQRKTAAEVAQALTALRAKQKLTGLVLDLRNNPGGLMIEATRLADLFLSKGLIVKTASRSGRYRDQKFAHRSGTTTDLPMVCLVNGGSASASEIVAGALQDHKRAVVLGQQTFGKGSIQSLVEFRDGSGLKLTTARYYTPSGRSIQERGIVPDILVQEAAPKMRKVKRSREADIKGHLRNKQKKRAAPAPRLKDFQLQTALDYLRAWAVFKK